MHIAFPARMHRIDLADPDAAVEQVANLAQSSRGRDSAIGLESAVCEAVESAVDRGVFLLATVTPDGADPAILTGMVFDVPDGWDERGAQVLRFSIRDLCPGVRDTLRLDTPIGPAVVAQRIPGKEQERDGQPMVLQLQGFIVDPEVNRMLVLTLACPSARGWDVHQQLFLDMIASASPDEQDEDEPYELRPVAL